MTQAEKERHNPRWQGDPPLWATPPPHLLDRQNEGTLGLFDTT